MSWQATDWADSLPYDAVSPIGFRVLIKLANVAATDGTRAFRSKKQLADELRVSERTIQRAFSELRAQGLVRLGDQRIVAHLRGGNRPTVFDLAMIVKRHEDAALDMPDEGGQQVSPLDGERCDRA